MTTAINTPVAKTYLEPGQASTCKATAAVTARRFVKVVTGGVGNHPNVQHATANGPVYGVAHHSAASGKDISVLRQGTFEVEAGENLASGDEVAAGTNGVAIKVVAASQSGTTPFAYTAATRAVGVCTADTTSGNGAPITLYQ